jgi:hypothetical protein
MRVRMRTRPAAIVVATAALMTVMTPALAATDNSDNLVTNGSPSTTFSQNKQNEPAVAVDPHAPSVVAAGANEEIDDEGCAAGDPTTCPFTQGVGSSGVYFSGNGGNSFTQPTYTGWTARDCLGPGACTPHVGPIGTLPGYYEAGLSSGGDPALAFGPRRGADGKFSWSNGSRLYYANLTANLSTERDDATFRGYEAMAVSRTDDRGAHWTAPTIVSPQSQTTFSDKEQIWADNAASSPYFGNVYVCWADYRSNSQGNALPTPLKVARSTDGGDSWTVKQVSPAADNGINSQPDGCTVRTDSKGTVFVFGIATRGGQTYTAMYRSTDSGEHWRGPTLVAPVTEPGIFDPVLGRPVMDGIAGARVDLAAGPSVDIANGAPTGADATDLIMMTWADGRDGLNHEKLMMTVSRDGGDTWSAPSAVATRVGDRPIYTAPALSPDGKDAYVVYNAYTTPYRDDTTTPRSMLGVVLHAEVTGAIPGAFSELHRGAPGDPRGTSQNNLQAGFIGDYVYAAATRDGVVGVWNDARGAADCPAVDAYRAALEAGASATPPKPATECPATFGNSDIYGGRFTDPTP